MKEILETLKELRGLEWPSKRGAFVYALALLFFSATIISVLSKWQDVLPMIYEKATVII